jgi:hypothetical protein
MTAGCIAAFRATYSLLDDVLADAFEVALMMAAFLWLGVFWLAIAVAAFLARRSGWPFRVLLATLVPLPLAVAVLGYLAYSDTLRRGTFDDNRPLLEGVVTDFREAERLGRETSEQDAVRIGECIFVPLEFSIDETAGFAQCSGSTPRGTNIEMQHLRDDWWWYYHMDGPFCTDEPCDLPPEP